MWAVAVVGVRVNSRRDAAKCAECVKRDLKETYGDWYVCAHVLIRACVYVCLYVHICIYTICMYISVYLCINAYMCVYIHTHTHTHKHQRRQQLLAQGL